MERAAGEKPASKNGSGDGEHHQPKTIEDIPGDVILKVCTNLDRRSACSFSRTSRQKYFQIAGNANYLKIKLPPTIESLQVSHQSPRSETLSGLIFKCSLAASSGLKRIDFHFFEEALMFGNETYAFVKENFNKIGDYVDYKVYEQLTQGISTRYVYCSDVRTTVIRCFQNSFGGSMRLKCAIFEKMTVTALLMKDITVIFEAMFLTAGFVKFHECTINLLVYYDEFFQRIGPMSFEINKCDFTGYRTFFSPEFFDDYMKNTVRNFKFTYNHNQHRRRVFGFDTSSLREHVFLFDEKLLFDTKSLENLQICAFSLDSLTMLNALMKKLVQARRKVPYKMEFCLRKLYKGKKGHEDDIREMLFKDVPNMYYRKSISKVPVSENDEFFVSVSKCGRAVCIFPDYDAISKDLEDILE
ncbi:unnamed protein product [Caenorhabditis auriculariae]|uniref:F-box domain-containing protein n=1 Tax=Caenorhabditis auriculariae TaxID=2777116 RepID=A0A8S1HS13_9PELO|nr:unnamed protein product [Caenorhabditis auriculariae]